MLCYTRIYGLGRREVEEQTRICHSQSFMHDSGMVHFHPLGVEKLSSQLWGSQNVNLKTSQRQILAFRLDLSRDERVGK